MKIVNLFVAAISCWAIAAKPSHLIKQCINSLPDDTNGFGLELAANDKYLAVGDSGANHIVIYTRNKDDKWLQTRKILPPKDSTAYKVGRGFGSKLVINGDVLIISNLIWNEVGNPDDFREGRNNYYHYSALYQTRLDRETEVKRIDLPDVPTKGVIPPNSVVADNGKIGFILSQVERHRKRINQVYVLSNGKAHALPNGELEYIYPSKVSRLSVYGGSMVLRNNLLLVSDQSEGLGRAWLFDLESPQSKPQKLTVPNATPPLFTSIAISDRFVAVGNSSISSIYRNLSEPFEKTLIINIATGSTKIISGTGELSLDSNILVRTRSVPQDREYRSVSEIPRILEVFRLDDDGTPHLIQKYSDVDRGLVQNRLLITVQKTASGKRICTKQIR